jgi:tetratricopeptide (TPR) repeat protein
MTAALNPIEALPVTLCDVCGLPQPGCGCAAMASRLRKGGDAALQHAVQEARLGQLHSARNWLHLALNIDPGNAIVWAASGCCAFVLGDVALTERAWRRSLEMDPSSPAADWIRSLESGSIRDGLSHFDTALRVAAEEQFERASLEIAKALVLVPDYGPATRLAGLIEAARGDKASALRRWREYLSRVGDDAYVLRLIASIAEARSSGTPSAWRSRLGVLAFAAGIAAAIIAGAIVREKYPTPTSAPVRQVARAPQRIAHAAGSPSAPTVQGRSRSHIGRTAYHEGRIAFESHNWRDAAASLQLAADFANHSESGEVRENALYLLAIAQSRLGDTLAARSTASSLLSEYPTSMFANSIAHSLARAGRVAVQP